jgi:hypothetical protein
VEAITHRATANYSHLTKGLPELAAPDISRGCTGSLYNYYMLNVFPDLCGTRNRNLVSTSTQNSRMLILQAYTHVSLKMNRGYAQKCLCLDRVNIDNLYTMNNYNLTVTNMHTSSIKGNEIKACMKLVRMYDCWYTLNKPRHPHKHNDLENSTYLYPYLYECMNGIAHHLNYVIKKPRHIVHLSLSLIILRSAPQIKLWGEADHETKGRNATPQNFSILTLLFYLSRMTQRATNSSSSQRYKEKLLALENDPDVEMFVTQKR